MTITPTISGCAVSGLGAAPVKTNHCALVLDSDTKTTISGQEHADVDLECESGNAIEIQVPSVAMTLKIGPQTAITHGVTYANVTNHGAGKKEAITVNTTAKGISYSCSGFGCFALEGGGSGTNGTYSGKAIVTGFQDVGVACVGTEKTTPTEACLKEGSQVDLTITNP